MERVDHRLTLDLTRLGSQGCIYARAGDTNAHRLYICLRMGAEKYLLEDVSITARARTIHGVISEYPVTVNDGCAVWDLDLSAFTTDETLECELYITSPDGASLVSPRFSINVDGAIIAGGAVG